jgi:hypothetical protein
MWLSISDRLRGALLTLQSLFVNSEFPSAQIPGSKQRTIWILLRRDAYVVSRLVHARGRNVTHCTRALPCLLRTVTNVAVAKLTYTYRRHVLALDSFLPRLRS